MAKEQTFEEPPRGHVGLLCYDPVNDRFQVVHVDASGHLQVDLAASGAEVEVTQTTPADLTVAQHQYTGSAWVKSNLLWGYHDIWDEDLGGTATGVEYSAATSAIPAGEIWVLQAISARNGTRDPTNIILYISRASGAAVYLAYEGTPGAGVPVYVTGQFALRTGDTANLYMGGTQADDVIEAGVVGYKMDITM